MIGYGVKPLYMVSTEPLKGYKVMLKAGIVSKDTRFLLAVANPAIKRKIVAENEDRWETYIHPTAIVSPQARIGRGCFLAPYALLCGNGVIGDFVTLNTRSTVSHDAVVEEYSTLYPSSQVCGHTHVAPDCSLFVGSFVLPNVSLPQGTKVSAGAVIKNTPPDNKTLYGNQCLS